MSEEPLPPALAAVAEHSGVEFRYLDQAGRPRQAPVSAVRAILAAMGVDAHSEAAARHSLEELELTPWRRLVEPSVVLTAGAGQSSAAVHVPADAPAEASLTLEDGGVRRLPVDLTSGQTRRVDGAETVAGLVRLPAQLPVGYHTLSVRARGNGRSREEQGWVIAAPAHCPLGPAPGQLSGLWGWMIQLYATRSSASWGIGDLGDLSVLSRWSGELGAGFLVSNPLHAVAPGMPQEPSPYYPSSRRFTNPLYLSIDRLPEVERLDPRGKAQIAQLSQIARKGNLSDRIDRDAAYVAKQQALEVLHAAPASAERAAAFQRYREQEGAGLVDFATYSALSEQHGQGWQSWPAHLRHPRLPSVGEARRELRDRVHFHMWLQWLCAEQLADAQLAARTAGMPIGIVHDLAVGVNPGGADAWALQDDLATAVTVGAPPDIYNARGQNWAVPPLVPSRLAETGYAPVRDMLRSVLRHAGGVRIDHILGLFRLFWIPQGAPPGDGAYVRYPSDALLSVVALEAERAGAIVIGEDLGTVPPGVHDALRDRRILSSRVLYFEHTPEGAPLPASDYAELALTTVTTHDLPTAAGWWTDEEVLVKDRLNLFADDTGPEEASETKRRAKAEMLQLLRDEGLVGEDPSLKDLVVAMHAFLARTPSLLAAGALWDGLADTRQPNMPATGDEYPNWRLPLAERAEHGSRPVLLETVMAHPLVLSVADALKRERGLAMKSQTQRSM